MNKSENISLLMDFVDNAKAMVVFAHGAGADKSSDFMQEFTQLLNDQQFSVLRFNFNYMDKRLVDGRRYPPERMPKLLTCFEQVIADLETDLPIFLMGKSMGGRVAATLAEKPLAGVNGIVCLGYPFHPQKQPEKLRLEPLQNTKQPILIIQGDRDALGNKDEISSYQFSSLCQLQYVADGDHNLKPRVKSGFTHRQHLATAAQSIVKFIYEQS